MKSRMERSEVNNAEFTISDMYKTDRRGPARWILSHTLHQWPLLILALLGAFGNAALAAYLPVMIGRAFNAITASPPQIEILKTTALLLFVSQAARGIIQFGRNFGFEWIAQRVERNVRNELYINLLGKSMTFHNLQSIGDTMARATNDVREVNFLFSPGVNMVVGSLYFLVMPLVLAPRYHPSLIITPLIFTVLYFLALREYLQTLGPITDHLRASFGRLNTRLAEALDGIETVKGAAQEAEELIRFNVHAAEYRKAVVKQGDVEARFLPLLLLSIATAGGLLHAFFLFKQGYLQIGDVVGYFGLILMLDFPTFASLFAYSRISSGLAGARRILDLINRENSLDQNINGYQKPMVGNVEFRNVCFSYPRTSSNENECEEAELSNINISVKSGQTVAVVGQTGSGKTTIARLINRTYDVAQGGVFVDGINVKDWNLETLRRNISIIEQDIFLFSRSIAENIAFGNQNATEEEIITAAKLAQAHEFIEEFPEGYKTVIGERGVTLSGGQRQRLALARAFLVNPKILILDDSTSAIDSATEDKIQRAIYLAARGRTTFVITHRLSQIRWADLIIVLRKGKIAAVGNHDELMNKSEAYRKIFSE